MILYDYLFYCSYKMGMRSNNFVGLPVLAGMMMVIPNVIIHVMTLDFIMCGLGVTWFAGIMKNKIFLGLFYSSILGLMYYYYSYKRRYEKIILKYDSRRNTVWKKHPIIVYILCLFVSMVLLHLSAMFYHKEGLFSVG